MNFNILIGIEVSQRWHSMHVRSPVQCAPTWCSFFVFLSFLLCHPQVSLTLREHSQVSVIFQQSTDGGDFKHCLLKHRGKTISFTGGGGKQKHKIQLEVLYSTCFFMKVSEKIHLLFVFLMNCVCLCLFMCVCVYTGMSVCAGLCIKCVSLNCSFSGGQQVSLCHRKTGWG